MKRLLTIIPLVILLCLPFSCQKGEDVAEESAVDIEADVEAIKALFVNNESVISAQHPRLAGSQNYRRH